MEYKYNTTKRRKDILQLLADGKAYTNQYLQDFFHISRSTLHEDKKALTNQGFHFIEQRGITQLDTSKSNVYYQPVKKASISKWILLLLVSHMDSSYSKYGIYQLLISWCKEYHISSVPSFNTISGYIDELTKSDFLIFENDIYHLGRYPEIISLTESDLFHFCENYALFGDFHRSSVLEEINRRFLFALNTDSFDSNRNYIFQGKHRFPSKKTLQVLKQFLDISCEQHSLILQYVPKDQSQPTMSITFKTGAFVYSFDKNIIYAFGENTDTKEKIILDLQYVETVQMYPKIKNNIFHSKEYLTLLEEMFSISVEDAIDVCVRFENVFQIPEKVERLHKMRKASTLSYTEDQKYICYHDRIRGLNDFANYLRQYGSSVIVDSPTILKEQMISSAKKILENYLD